ncbi:peptide chain release factor 2 [Pyxidicoccus fallax]|uniref:Peptide chain release factor 2 n=1 Tax=Pyxidicoccus fallax TaxID=394095 RepID=A0A848LVE4_9BACT|nr:peptide chain release factor 2 [Pyxidicoccus fallax]NPC79083.1 peptide chain release factor 2 [Pyxidicoccus fallax]
MRRPTRTTPWRTIRWRRSAASESASWRSGGIFDLDRKRSRIALIERDSTLPNFWDDNTKAQALLKEKSTLEASVGAYDKVMRGLDDAQTLLELAAEANDADTAKEAEGSLESLEGDVAKLELARMLSGEQDRSSCFMDINAGAGGTDSMDWAAMLLRMYTRYCEAKGWKVEINDEVPGEEAGFKNVSLRIEGDFAYGYLKAEVGVHRLVRISPFDANARRQTAFASVDVYPEVDDTIQIDIPEKDIELKFIRGGGAGGQKVNKTSSTAQLRHLPTGIIITCQTERSQSANKDMAFKILRGRLYELEMKKREAARDAAEAQKKDISFGSQIRSYVLAPYRMVKDLRTGVETGNVDAVLDGELEDFVTAQLLGVKNPNRGAGAD